MQKKKGARQEEQTKEKVRLSFPNTLDGTVCVKKPVTSATQKTSE
jgi:hypothetical protein